MSSLRPTTAVVATLAYVCFVGSTRREASAAPPTITSVTPNSLRMLLDPSGAGSLAFVVRGRELHQLQSARVRRGAAVLPSVRATVTRVYDTLGVELRCTGDPGPGGASSELYGAAGASVEVPTPLVFLFQGRRTTGGGPTARATPVVSRAREAALAASRRALPRRGKVPPGRLDPKGLRTTVEEYAPESAAPTRGNVVLHGRNLRGRVRVRLGEQALPILVESESRVVFRLPRVEQTLTADLVLESGNLAIHDQTDVRVLRAGFRVCAPSDLPPTAELIQLDASVGNAPYHRNEYVVRFANVPGERLRGAVIQFPDELIQTKELTIGAGVEEVNGERYFFGHSFTVAFSGKPLEPLTSIPVRLRTTYLDPRTQDSQIPIDGLPVSIPLPPPEATAEYRVDATMELRELLSFRLSQAWGTATGVSESGEHGRFDVGLVPTPSDIAFRLASGPFGSRAQWESVPLLLREGWMVRQVRWRIVQDHPADQPAKARVRLGGAPPAATVARTGLALLPAAASLERVPDYRLFPVNGASPAVPMPRPPTNESFLQMYFLEELEEGGATFLDYGKDRFDWFLRPFSVFLDADATLVNDHRVTVVLESLTLVGPTSRAWNEGAGNVPAQAMIDGSISFVVGARDSTLRLIQLR